MSDFACPGGRFDRSMTFQGRFLVVVFARGKSLAGRGRVERRAPTMRHRPRGAGMGMLGILRGSRGPRCARPPSTALANVSRCSSFWGGLSEITNALTLCCSIVFLFSQKRHFYQHNASAIPPCIRRLCTRLSLWLLQNSTTVWRRLTKRIAR